LDRLSTFAIFNPGSICIEIEGPGGGYVFPPSVNNYNRPGVLTALCSPDFAPFMTGSAFECATEQVIAESTVALECYCD
jgi:hypothetical protein